MSLMSKVQNGGEQDYPAKIRQAAVALATWPGPIVIISHIDPDGDALGSTLALKRALDSLGKSTRLIIEPPRYLSFLVREGELSKPLSALPESCLLAVLDVEVGPRATGAPLAGAAKIVNIDHHGTNPRHGDLSVVQPSRAATAHMVKDLIDALGVAWTLELAEPCLTGILTDTGNFRFSNTSPEVLHAAGELIATGLDYVALTDRLQWRPQSYYPLLGKVMDTVEFPLGGLLALAQLTQAMRAEVGNGEDDSDDFVGIIRYAEGVKLAVLLKEKIPGQETKVSVRSRDGVSAQAVCLRLGGGGHVAAAGATIYADLATARRQVLAAAREELRDKGFTLKEDSARVVSGSQGD
ncbi:MAG: DHH family phosphoesterase [Truepera sp.]|nr:DHH family phosphoesterase [Truepera sp.]